MKIGPSRLGVGAAVLTLIGLAAACGGDDDGGSATGPTSSISNTVQTFPVPSPRHVQGRVNYAQTPPVGGNHNDPWQNCGFYPEPVESERAVHSLEHGAVWVTYRPNLPKTQVDVLRQLARSRAYVLVSRWKDSALPAPVVASAWGAQLKLSSATHPALADFIAANAGGGRAPEPGGPCTGAFGNPE